MDQKLLDSLRQIIPQTIAEELLSVQPMSTDAFKKVLDDSMSEADLIAAGYKPVSPLKLMWVKK
jgi:hypothetical protein